MKEVIKGAPTNKLYLGNLSFGVTEDNIKAYLSEFGGVLEVDVILNSEGKSKGFAFATMDSVDSAQATIDELDKSEWMGREINVSFAVEKSAIKMESKKFDSEFKEGVKKVYIGNVSFNKTEEELKAFCEEKAGPVSSVKIVIDPSTKKSKGFAFVEFKSTDAAKVAVKTLNNFVLDGRTLNVNSARERKN